MIVVASQTSLQEIIAAVHGWCETHPVKLCAVFGSQATGKVHPGSDVDIAVWPTCELEPLTKLRWVGELERLLNSDVTLVIVSARLDPVLGWEIAREGVLVFEDEEGLWMHHRAQRWHAYNDALPFRRALRDWVLKPARERKHGP